MAGTGPQPRPQLSEGCRGLERCASQSVMSHLPWSQPGWPQRGFQARLPAATPGVASLLHLGTPKTPHVHARQAAPRTRQAPAPPYPPGSRPRCCSSLAHQRLILHMQLRPLPAEQLAAPKMAMTTASCVQAHSYTQKPGPMHAAAHAHTLWRAARTLSSGSSAGPHPPTVCTPL